MCLLSPDHLVRQDGDDDGYVLLFYPVVVWQYKVRERVLQLVDLMDHYHHYRHRQGLESQCSAGQK